MKLILIRHPHTENNALRRFPGSEATPYTAQGEREYAFLLAQDHPDWMIYTSPHKRCSQLARAMAERRREQLCIDMRLREIECGDFAGLTFDEIAQKYPSLVETWFAEPIRFCYPNGECREELEQRVLTFFRELKHDAIIISHQAVLSVIGAKLGDEQAFSTGEMRFYDYTPHP